MTDTTLTAARQRAIAAQEAVRAAQAETADSIKLALVEGLAPIFEKYPFLGSVAWTQYTPYFNDGDPCVFSSNIGDPSCNSVADLENGTYQQSYEDGEDFSSRADEELYGGYDNTLHRSTYAPNPSYDSAYRACKDEVEEFLRELQGDEKRNYRTAQPTTFDSALLQAFGDHAAISVTRDGKIVVDEYSHD